MERGKFAGSFRRAGAHANVDAAGAEAFQEAVAGDHALDGGAVPKHADDDAARSKGIGGVGGEARALPDECVCFRGGAVVDGEGVTALEQVMRHRQAQIAETDEADCFVHIQAPL